jgi:hypothetical protein
VKFRYAEDANYWETTVHPAKSQGEIVELLENFGADSVMVVQGQAGGNYAWMIRFRWDGRNYRFLFTPLACRTPEKQSSFGGKRRAHSEQARYQMARTATHFVKAILTAAEAEPGALFGFMELPGAGSRAGVPAIASEIDVRQLVDDSTPLLPDIIVDRDDDDEGGAL